MAKNKPSLYLISVLLFMLLLPVASILVEWQMHTAVLSWFLIGKWFVFWVVGVRLTTAGIRQVTKPAFTAKEIFNFNSDESYPVIRELGFANISIGIAGILSLFKPEWCSAAAITGGLYFGLVGLMHVIKKPAGGNEVIAMVSDLLFFILMAAYLFFVIVNNGSKT